MKIFLGNSPWKKPGFFGVRAGSRWPHFEKENAEYMPFPFFLGYATALLEQYGFEVMLVDGIAEKMGDDEFLEKIVTFNPALVFLEVSTISIEWDLKIVARIKKLLGSRIKIALGGLHTLMYAHTFLEENPMIDFILIGEYEATLLELSQKLKVSGSLKVPGLIYREKDGKVFINEKRAVIEDINILPWPARHHLPMYNYRDEPGNIERPSVQIWSSRGCPYQCTFCAWPQIMYNGNSYRKRDIKDVCDEIEWLINEYGFKSFYIDDDTFNIDKKHVLNFCNELETRSIKLPWATMARADLMDKQQLERMREAGLLSIKYGIESADEEILKKSGKKLRLGKVLDTIQLTKSLGIKYHLTFMFGLPGETKESAQKTLDLALRLNPESLQFTLATPFPGSALFNKLKAENKLVTYDFSKYDGFHSAVIKTEFMEQKELEEFILYANKKWTDFRYGSINCN